MSFRRLPPVGDPVRLARHPDGDAFLRDYFAPWAVRFYASGTVALAAALRAALQRRPVAHPEVIIPAYTCPDLVSAIEHAGARPRLVDLLPQRPWLDPDAVAGHLGEQTVALVAVDAFGIPEQLPRLRALADAAGVVLIEDAAQAFPLRSASADWRGDYVIFSFGRGKPLSLLGGGAVLARDVALAGALPQPGEAGDSRVGRGLNSARLRLYNRLLSPWCYGALTRMPLLGIGETRYAPLAAGYPGLAASRRAMLAANLKHCHPGVGGPQKWFSEVLRGQEMDEAGLVDIPRVCGVLDRRLLRYPVLAPTAVLKQRLLAALHAQGLGASGMYPAILPQIPGLEWLARQGDFVHAADWAARLLTLPLHPGVRRSTVERIVSHIHATLGTAG